MELFLKLLRAQCDRDTRTQVAARIGVSGASMDNYLRRKQVPGGDVVIRAMHAFPALRACAVPPQQGSNSQRDARGLKVPA